MAFGFEHWKTTPAGSEAACAIKCKREEVVSAAKAGHAPIRVIAPDIEDHLGDKIANAYVGRLVREWLGPSFKVKGRIKWPRQHGTESGAVYLYVG